MNRQKDAKVSNVTGRNKLNLNVTRITDLTYFAKVMRGPFLKCATSKPPLQLNVIDVL